MTPPAWYRYAAETLAREQARPVVEDFDPCLFDPSHQLHSHDEEGEHSE